MVLSLDVYRQIKWYDFLDDFGDSHYSCEILSFVNTHVLLKYSHACINGIYTIPEV